MMQTLNILIGVSLFIVFLKILFLKDGCPDTERYVFSEPVRILGIMMVSAVVFIFRYFRQALKEILKII